MNDSVRFPEVTLSTRADGVTAGLTPERVLFVGTMATGTATSGELIENILLDGAEADLFGADSPLAIAIGRAREQNKATQFDAIGLADVGTQAAGSITFTGTATATGEFVVSVGSKKNNKYKVPVVLGDTAAMLATKLADLVTADALALVTAVAAGDAVNFTAKAGGTWGNNIGIKTVGRVLGLTHVAVAMVGGAGDPVVTGVFDVAGGQRYQGIVWQYDQELDEVKDFLDGRLNVQNDVLDGVAFVGMTDTLANHLTTLGALNSESLSINVDKLVVDDCHMGAAVMDMPFFKVADFAAIRALRRTSDAVLSDKVIARSARDGFGGIHSNSKPYANTPFSNLEIGDVGAGFNDIEVEQLQAAGGWVIARNRAGTEVISNEVVTTYKTDNAGNPDVTFTFLNYVDTASAYREYMVNNIRAKYPQYRAKGGALSPLHDDANEASVAAYIAELNANLVDESLVNGGIGSINGVAVDYDRLFADNLSVTLNPATGVFFVSMKAYIVVQFRGLIGDIAIAFEV